MVDLPNIVKASAEPSWLIGALSKMLMAICQKSFGTNAISNCVSTPTTWKVGHNKTI